MSYEKFYAKARGTGNKTYPGIEISIPIKICRFAGIQEGDLIKAMVKKIKPPKLDVMVIDDSKPEETK